MFEDPEKYRQQLRDIVEQIRAVLAIDLRDFPVRAAKKRYLTLPEFAATLTAERLGELKSSLNRAAEETTQEILRILSEEAIWTDHVTPSGSSPSKTLRDNKAVTEALARIARATQEVLKEYRFPEVLLDIHYDPPTWFINGQYLPGLIEKYWKNLAELRQHTREHKRAQHETDIQMLAERWEDA